MTEVWAVGAASTGFQKWPERTHRSLATEVVSAARQDAGIGDRRVDGVWFGSCAMQVFGQDNIRGQVALQDAMRAGQLEPDAPIVNVEGGCATGTAALHGAFTAVGSGQARLALAVGVEKTWVPHDPARSFALFAGGIDQMHPDEWKDFYEQAGARAEQRFEPHPQRIVFLDVHAMAARRHMVRFGTTVEDLAGIASKNHGNGVHNPKAQLRKGLSSAEILADRAVIAPFTRSMCAPISDGAAAVLLVDRATLAELEPSVRERAVRVRAVALGGGTWRELDQDDVTVRTARRAYQLAGLTAAQVDLAEVHDANAWCELHATEALGFCGPGEGGAYAASGATARGGARPVNASGGLIARGHPLAATGLGMVDELMLQLRGEAGARQVARASVGLAQNAGGMIGFDEALCGVTILERA